MTSVVIVLIVLIVGVPVGRQLGWSLSKAILYPVPIAISVSLCVAWGCAVAHLTLRLLEWQHVRLFWEAVTYAAGGYISIQMTGCSTKLRYPMKFK